MAPPRPTITPHIGVPKVSFRKIPTTGKEYDGVDDKIAHQYGYNEVNVSFDRPDHYIRYVEPMESDLSAQVEYDMDEQDDEWLAAINKERYKDQNERVTSETFEIIIDRLEKEWFDLMKRIPKPDQSLPSEDSTCAVCDDGEGENSNAIVFCDGCNLAVHQDCYGVPYIPEGQWLCRKCTVAPESRVECILCPNDGGAFKQTSTGKWAHLLCAIWVPECILGNPTFMEPIENSDKIPKQRWKLVCSICKVKQGACIQCNKNTCVTAFHVSCARKQKLLSPMKSHGEGELQAFCEKHLPAEMRVNRVVPPSPSLPPTAPASPVRSPKKAARTQIQTTGPPLVPAAIVEKIMQYTSRIAFRKKLPFLLAVCRYWSLKREARRGAPLLKRLHLEPWTTSTASKLQTDEEKLKYIANLNRLKVDLERVRELADLVRKRETEKQSQVLAIESLVTSYLLPFDAELRKTYESVIAFDRSNHFMNPVSRTEVPDYYMTVEKPMHWLGIYAKIEQHEYLDSQAFVDDVHLVLDNAIKYNKKDTVYHKAAHRIRNNVQPILELFQATVREKIALWMANEPQLDVQNNTDAAPLLPNGEGPHATNAISTEGNPANIGSGVLGDNSQLDPTTGETLKPTVNGAATPMLEDEVVPATPTPEPNATNQTAAAQTDSVTDLELTVEPGPPAPSIGDLEPFPPILRMLQDQASVTEDLPYILNADPLTSFFTYERPILKPPPPPPPPPPPKQSRKHKRKHTITDSTTPGPSRGAPSQGRTTRGNTKGEPSSPQHPHPQRVVLLVRDPAQSNENGVQVEGGMEPTPGSTPTVRNAKRKRQDSVGLQIVDDVNAHTSFTMFESGWVLPPGTTRTRRPTANLPPPKPSNRKTSKEPKRVRMSSSVLGDGRTPTVGPSRQSSQMPLAEPTGSVLVQSGGPPVNELQQAAAGEYFGSAIASHSLQPRTPELESTPVVEAPQRLVSSPTPRTRESSSDLSELSDKGEAQPPPLPPLPPLPPQPSQPSQPPQPHQPHQPTRSPQSPQPPQPPQSPQPSQPSQPPEPAQPAPVRISSGIHHDAEGEPIHYEAGTLVWARQAGFPWYPAVVFEPPDESIPPSILKHEKIIRQKMKDPGRLYLVQFYDKMRTWTWVPLSKLTMLGEVQAIDQKYLHPTGKQSGNKKDIQAAYEMALREMETAEEETERTAANVEVEV